MCRRLLWEGTKADAARNRQAGHAVSPGNPLAPLPLPRRPQLPAPSHGARQQGSSSSKAPATKPPHSPASLAALPFQFLQLSPSPDGGDI